MRPEQRDSYLTTHTTHVKTVDSRPDGSTWISFGESLFYPTSGGQPHDEGRVECERGEARVVDVTVDKHDAVADVLHRVEGVLPSAGDRVTLRLDWDRRYRHMQRHSAQHLLSQALLHVDPAFTTESVALTSSDITIDVLGSPTDTHASEATELARTWAYANLEIRAFEVPHGDLDRYPLRRPPKVTGSVRLVQMGEIEIAACGGTHLARTCELLPLLYVGRQRIRGDLTRLSFRAGLEASELAQWAVAEIDSLAAGFSAARADLAPRIDALRGEVRAARAAAHAALGTWAERCVSEARAVDPAARVVKLAVEVGDGLHVHDALTALAQSASAVAPNAIAVLGVRQGERAQLLLQAGPELESGVDVRPALAAALPLIEGRGGGKPDRAQGSGSQPAQLHKALEAAATALQEGR